MKRANLIVLIFTLFFYSCQSCQRQGQSGKSNTVSIRTSQDPESLNPVNYPNTTSLEIINLVFQGLLVPDTKTKEIHPLLAEQLPVVQKKDSISVFDYTLNKKARWPNNQPVTAADVAFSLKLYRCPLVGDQRIASRFYFIKEVIPDKANPTGFKLVCDKYTPEMDLMTGDFAVLPEYLMDPKGLLREFSLAELTQNYDSLGNHPKIKEFAAWFKSDRFSRNKAFLQGSGGYELDAWETGRYIRLKKKQNWWGEDLEKKASYMTANPDKIIYKIIPDNATTLLAVQKEEIDVFPGIPAGTFKQLMADPEFKSKFNLYTPESYTITYLGINSRLPKFADSRTRQALASLIDVNQIINVVQKGFATPTVGPVIPSEKRYYNSAVKPYAFDPEKATALLQQAGWVKKNNGWQKKLGGRWVPLTVTLNYKANNTEFESIALFFKEAAAKINIPVNIQPVEGMLLTKNLNNHQFEMFIRYLLGNPFVNNFREILHTESAAPGGANHTGFGTPESDQLIDQINSTADETVKARNLKRLQEILHEQSNLIYLYFSKERIAVNKRFTNLKISGIKPGYDVSAFTLKDQ